MQPSDSQCAILIQNLKIAQFEGRKMPFSNIKIAQ